MANITIPQDFDLEARVQKAKDNFKAGYNCCQAVVLAYNDIIGLDQETAASVSSGFGGGMGRMREVCGSVTGMFMIAGFVSPATDPTIKTDRTANYAMIQELAGEFRQENGSIVCKELLGLSPIAGPESPEPSDRTREYYKKRPCEELVGISARIIGKRILQRSLLGHTVER